MTVLVAGEAGIGKSRLVNEFTLHASRGGTSVLRGACVALIQDGLAFAPLMEALRGFLHHLESTELAALIAEDRGLLSRLLPELGGCPDRRGTSVAARRVIRRHPPWSV
jgi:predicted ATPase